MIPFPAELITLAGSSIVGSLMRLWGASLESRRQERLLTLQALNTRAHLVDRARQYSNSHYQWTRRIIALTAVFFVIAFPKLVVLWFPQIPVHVAYPELTQGFLFFTADSTETRWADLTGLVITPLDTHLLSAIIGLYFGGSLAGHN